MSFRHTVAAILALASLPASATITFSGAFTVAGEATDLSGMPATQGNNRLSFGSDLVYDRLSDTFYGITDRGPGGGVVEYAPRLNTFKLNVDPTTGKTLGFALKSTIVFTKEDGTVFSGLNPLLRSGSNSTLGDSFDPEGIVRLANGHYLISDEYGPAIYEFDAAGKRVRSFTTPANLVPKQADGTTVNYVDGRPTIVTGRQDNRGFEGITLSNDGTKAYAILQDPLVNEGLSDDGRRSRNLRIVEFDVAKGTALRQLAYRLEDRDDINARIPGTANDFSATNQGRSIGVSAIHALPDGSFLVIERDNRGLGVDDPTGAAPIGSKRVYRITLDGATDVSGTSFAGSNALPAGVVAVKKLLFLDVQSALLASGLDPVEKIEGISFGRSLTGDGLSLYLVTDNDFSVTQTGSFGNQSDVCSTGEGGTFVQTAIGAGCPGALKLLPSYIYSFRVDGSDAAGLAVPEPATWALMVGGFGLIGTAMRRRKVSPATATV